MQYINQNNKLKVTKTLYKEDGTTYEIDTEYTREFLNNQVDAITIQRNEMIALKENELAEVNALLAKCDELEVDV